MSNRLTLDNYYYFYEISLYRNLYKRYNVNQSTFWILYLVKTNSCPPYQNEIIKYTNEPKQTINTAIKKLESSGYIQLIDNGKRNKEIVITDSGNQYCQNFVDKLIQAEENVVNSLSKKEYETLMDINKKRIELLEREFNKISYE